MVSQLAEGNCCKQSVKAKDLKNEYDGRTEDTVNLSRRYNDRPPQ